MAEESLDDGQDSGRVQVVVIELWPENAEIFDVFALCTIDGIGAGMGGIAWTGIAAAEIRAACALHRVPLARRLDVAADVKFMGDAVAGERNRRAERDANRRK